MGRTQRLVIAGLLGLLAVLILSFVVILVSTLGPGASTAIQPTATPATPTATPTPPPLAITPQQGWLTASTHLAFTQDIAFAQSDPYMGYACGVTNNATPAPLQFSITNDGGRTWKAQAPTTLKYTSCSLKISPTNANWLSMTAVACGPCFGDELPDNLVSHNSGRTWTVLKVPAGENTSVRVDSLAWAGTDLLVGISIYSQTPTTTIPTHLLAASINGASLQWVDNAAFYTQAGAHPQSIGVQGLESRWLIMMNYPMPTTGCNIQYGCLKIMQSADHGATWSSTTVALDIYWGSVAASSDGKTLLGIQYLAGGKSALFSSRDTGATWQPLPTLSLPATDNTEMHFSTAPDGSIFLAIVISVPNQGITQYAFYTLTSDGSSWLLVDSEKASLAFEGYGSVALSCNAQGQPIALWGIEDQYNGLQLLSTKVVYHAPVGA